MLCDDLEGWDGERGRRLEREGNVWLICVVVWQKQIQHCKFFLNIFKF